MAYDFYLGETRMPVSPSKLQMKINGRNKTITLIDEGEVNLLKKAGLTEITFTLLLPNVLPKVPPNVQPSFARYDGGFQNAAYYLDRLEQLKIQMQPFQFIVSRALPNGKLLYDTNLKVTLEDYKITDDVKQGFDVTVDVTLKQYRAYGTKVVDIDIPTATATVEPTRSAESAPNNRTYTVVKGDSLWAIAQSQLGNGSRYPEIYALNQSAIDARNKGTGNTKYTIYPGQVFALPS